MPLVSVLLPTHARNRSGLLSNAISSVLDQEFKDFELFVLDDGSSDGSAETIQEFCKRDNRVRHIRFEKNIGLPALTAAHAFIQSSGEYIAWQFDDCVWEKEHLSELVKIAQNQAEPVIVYGQAKVKTNNGELVLGDNYVASDLEFRNFIPNVSTLIDRRIFNEIGWFDPSVILKRVCDYDFWYRASKKFKFIYIPKVIATENGLILNDSLGNSVSLFGNLANKVIKSDRSQYLLISNINNWNPFACAKWMDDNDVGHLAYLTLEHFLRIKDLRGGLIEYSKLIGTQNEATYEMQIAEMVNWYVKKSRDIFVSSDPLLVGYFRYIYNCFNVYGIKGIIPIIKAVINVSKRKILS